jgi:hypothetical protein
MKSKIPAPPSLLRRLPKKLHLKKRVLLTLTTALAPLAHKLLLLFIFLHHAYFSLPCLFSYICSSEEGEQEEPANLCAAPTSTSHTVILSEENRTAAESLPPPQ